VDVTFIPGQLCRVKPANKLTKPQRRAECWSAIWKCYVSIKTNHHQEVDASFLYDIGREYIGIYLGCFPELNDCDLSAEETHQALFNEQRVWINLEYFEPMI